MNAGLLVLRLLLGLVLLAHSSQKTLGWLQGPGLTASAGIFEGLGQRPGRAMVKLAAACEAVAAVLLLLGALTPLGAAIAAGTLLVAGASQTLRTGKVWTALGGGEYPIALAIVALAVGFTGPGEWSVDRALLNDLPGYTGLVVVAVAVVAAVPPTVRARRELQRLRGVSSADL